MKPFKLFLYKFRISIVVSLTSDSSMPKKLAMDSDEKYFPSTYPNLSAIMIADFGFSSVINSLNDGVFNSPSILIYSSFVIVSFCGGTSGAEVSVISSLTVATGGASLEVSPFTTVPFCFRGFLFCSFGISSLLPNLV